jgi:hypothetical protein
VRFYPDIIIALNKNEFLIIDYYGHILKHKILNKASLDLEDVLYLRNKNRFILVFRSGNKTLKTMI